MVANISMRTDRHRAGRCAACVFAVAALAALAAPTVRAEITTGTLLAEMTDLDALTRFPDPPFTCRQFSSYDRKSTAPNQPEPPLEGWFANADANQYLRVEQNNGRTEYVLMDVAGPGAIVRIWSANPKGTLRFYFDGETEPAWEVPMLEFLGGLVPLVPEPIAGMRSRGWNSYLPMAYAKHCKVTCDTNDFYYHVNYRTYPEGTPVRTFRPGDLAEHALQIAEVARMLAVPAATGRTEAPNMHPGAGWVQLIVAAGAEQTVREWTGPMAITDLSVRVTAGDLEKALRRSILTITFDGKTTVACPLGDFFGSAPGLNPYESLPMGVALDGTMWSHWRMPFRESAVIRLKNLSDQPVRIDFGAFAHEYKWDDRSLYFHCKWRCEPAVPTRPMIDWTYLATTGRGVYVGASFNIANPVRHWWGEGDEKVYVDNESFPSTFGTGTEDYFGYAWCYNRAFTHAYHAQPRCDGPGNYGLTSNCRWHVLDRIPFNTAFRFDMEFWHWHDAVKADLAVAAYWYGDKDGHDEFPALTAENVHLPKLPPYEIIFVEGAIEAERLRLIANPGGGHYTPHPVAKASNDEVGLWHHGRKVGDKLELGFAAPKAGQYRVLTRILKNHDLATVRMSINGVAAEELQDAYAPQEVLGEEVELGTFELREGENVLTVEIVGAHEKALPRYNWAFDYLRLEPATTPK